MDRREFVTTASGSLVLAGTATQPVAAASADVDYSPSLLFIGQSISITGADIEAGETYDLRIVESFDGTGVEDSSHVREVTADSSGEIELETDSLEAADYFLSGETLPDQPDRVDTFEVVIQRLDVSFEPATIEQGLGGIVDIDSNRGSYTLDISSSGMDADELTSLFIEEGEFELANEQPGGNTIRLEETNDVIGEVRTTEDLPAGDFTFDFDVIDTVANDSPSVTIQEANRNVNVKIPEEVTAEADTGLSVPVRFDGASSGLSGYSFTVSIDETDVVTIDDINLDGADVSDPEVDVAISDAELSINVGATEWPKVHNARVATINLTAADRDSVAVGQLTLTDVIVSDDTNEDYDVDVSEGTTITVDRPEEGVTDLKGTIWRGESAVSEQAQFDPENIYDLRVVDGFDNQGDVDRSTFVAEFSPDEEGRIKLDTDGFDEGDYFIRDNESQHFYPPDGETFEIKEQTLSAEFDVDQLETGNSVELSLDSNREEEYTLTVSAQGDLTEEQLIESFVDAGDFELKDPHFGDNETIELVVTGSPSGDVEFDVPAKTYNLDFETRITNAASTEQIIVSDDSVPEGDFFDIEITGPEDGATIDHQQSILVTADVTNVGSEAGEKTTQLTEPQQDTSDLVSLAPTETSSVDFTIPASMIEEGDEITITVETSDDIDTVVVTAEDPCFIATAAYDTPTASEIDVLRDFRDDVLKTNWLGEHFVTAYYTTSPPIADWIRASKQRRRIVRHYFVEPMVSIVGYASGR